MKRTIEHYRKQQMTSVKAAFQSFVRAERTKVKKKAIRKLIIESEEQQQGIDFQNENISTEKTRVKAIEVKQKRVINLKSNRLDKTVDIMSRRNEHWVFASKKRAIFENWRHAVKQ